MEQNGFMTNVNEILSAVLDGECSAAELDQLLDASRRSPDLFRRFGRYCAQREASAGTRFDFDAETLCASVMSQIGPAKRTLGSAFRRQVLTVARPLGGLALAASLGAMATIGLYRYTGISSPAGQSGSTTPRASVIASTSPVSSGVSKTADRVRTATPLANEVRWTKLAPNTTRVLDDYMIYDSAYRSVQGMGSALTYARVAAQESALSFPRGTSSGNH